MRTRGNTGSRAFVNQFMVYSLVAICCSASIGLGTVWMRHQISLVANENKDLEAAIAKVEHQVEETDAAIAAEQDPSVLSRKNVEWGLGLVPPGETQVRRVTEDPVARLFAIQNRKLFGEGKATINLKVALAH
jgi:hypothetical protein